MILPLFCGVLYVFYKLLILDNSFVENSWHLGTLFLICTTFDMI